MAALTAKRRKHLPDVKFAGPNRTYPIDTKARAINAKARAAQQVKKGNLTKAQEARIDAKANKVIKRKKK